MMRELWRSLQVRLAIRLAAVYVVATAIAVAILLYQAYDTAGSLNDRELGLRAADLARYIVADSSGAAHLELPPKLAAAYGTGSLADLFAIRQRDRLVAASLPEFGKFAARSPAATDEPNYFHLSDFGGTGQSHYGLTIELASAAGPVTVTVARAADANVLVHSLLREFVFDIAWTIPLLVLATLGIGIWAIRSGLKPLRKVSRMAATIGPSAISTRLPESGLPGEIVPLVAAVNRALGRLERGFAVQREFTANAAHELRTPLAIVTAQLDAMEGNGELARLKEDTGRMTRLVEQLLRVARLDAVALDTSARVDLSKAAADVVAYMAPLAVAANRSLALLGAEAPVPVKGNRHAIEDAIRNLVENAIAYAPPRSEVTVEVDGNGSVSVCDQGPGVAKADREHIFQRFWRARGAQTNGAGLGLSIVQEIMAAHGGSAVTEDNPSGGAVFKLVFPPDTRSRADRDQSGILVRS
jgi:two-component system, OmpR family, sensor histidine kinase TctE